MCYYIIQAVVDLLFCCYIFHIVAIDDYCYVDGNDVDAVVVPTCVFLIYLLHT